MYLHRLLFRFFFRSSRRGPEKSPAKEFLHRKSHLDVFGMERNLIADKLLRKAHARTKTGTHQCPVVWSPLKRNVNSKTKTINPEQSENFVPVLIYSLSFTYETEPLLTNHFSNKSIRSMKKSVPNIDDIIRR